MPGPIVPERVHRTPGGIGRAGDIHAGTTGQAHSFAGRARASDGEVREAVKTMRNENGFPSTSSTTRNGKMMSALAMFTGNDAALPFPLRASPDRVDAQLDQLI